MTTHPDQDVVVRVEHLSKRFKLYDGAWQRLADWLGLPPRPRYQEFWALRDVSFEVGRGECLGIIGPNGAGKSTLLKLLTGALHPTSGRIAVQGRVLSLIELGAGFNPELTGRQNVEQSARLLGFPPQYAAERMDEIERFAEIGEYFERPIKLYSSGMLVRLAFSVFSAMDPEVFLVDEALAVGDLRFADKALARIRQMLERGTTLLFVSHSLPIINELCTRALWLHAGAVQMDGHPLDVTRGYQQFIVHGTVAAPSIGSADGEQGAAGGALYLGRGWYPLEAYRGEVFRWAGPEAEVVLEPSDAAPCELVLDLEPGPAAGTLPATVQITNGSDHPPIELTLAGRQKVRVPLPPSDGPRRLRLRASGEGVAPTGDTRELALRAFGWGWDGQPELRPIEQAVRWTDEAADAELGREVAAMHSILQSSAPREDAPARIARVVARNRHGIETVRFATYESLTLEITLDVLADVRDLVLGVHVRDMYDREIWTTWADLQTDRSLTLEAGRSCTITYAAESLLLGQGLYAVTLSCRRKLGEDVLLHWVDAAWKFEVVPSPTASFIGLADIGLRYAGGRVDDHSGPI